jgi:regulatory protein
LVTQPAKTKPEVSLRARALRMLARREHTRIELARKLSRFEAEPAVIEALLAELEQTGALSEARAVEQTAASRSRRFGAQRIAYELRGKGVAEERISTAVAVLKKSEMERARGVWTRKFGAIPADRSERARQIRFMQNRGFGLETVLRIVDGKD